MFLKVHQQPVRKDAEYFINRGIATLAFDGRLFIMDLDRQGVVRLSSSGFLDIVAGSSNVGSLGDGGPGGKDDALARL